MIIISKAKISDIPAIQKIANLTWPKAFKEILAPDQITYMLNLIYSSEALQNQFASQHIFLLAQEGENYLGFCSYEINYQSFKTKIHKIYLLPQAQGLGIGKKLMLAVEESAKLANQNSIILNVNKYNQAISFYENFGFKNIAEEIIDIGNGYIMDDYVMEKSI